MKKMVNSVDNMEELAALGEKLGFKETDLSFLVGLTTLSVAVGAAKQQASCGAECPYSYALGCLISGQCTKPAGHSGMHKDGRGHKWG